MPFLGASKVAADIMLRKHGWYLGMKTGGRIVAGRCSARRR